MKLSRLVYIQSGWDPNDMQGSQGLLIDSPRTPFFGLRLQFFLKIYQNHYMGLQLFLALPSGTPILKCLVRSLDMFSHDVANVFQGRDLSTCNYHLW